MFLEIGRLYRHPRYYFLVYPSIRIATKSSEGHFFDSAGLTPEWSRFVVNFWAQRFSREFDCTVRYSKPNEVFMVVDHEKRKNDFNCYHVIFGKIQGWIIFYNWMKIERVL